MSKVRINCDLIYPVGSIYLSVNSTNPSTSFGGTWEQIANGRTLVGVDTAQTEFNTVRKIGGSKELQEHNHDSVEWLFNGATNTPGAHYGNELRMNTGVLIRSSNAGKFSEYPFGNYPAGTGNSGNLQPYFTCYIWLRIK